MIKKINKFINDNRDGIVSAAPTVSSAFGIKQGTVGLIGSAIGSLIPGPAGAAVQVASLFAGTGDHRTVNELTGEIEGDNGTGIIGGIQKLFGWGRSTNSLMNKQNRIKASLADQQLTQDLNYNFYSDPNNSTNGSIFATAAEGGIMRQPVDVLISKGELIYNPVTKKLSKVPGSKGKPNKEDNVYAKLAEGDVVISNSPTMLMTNGKTPALNLEGLVDSNKNQKAKEAIIKKVVNWQEANKTKSKEFKKYAKGTPYVQLGEDPIKKLESDLFKPQTPEIKGKDRRWVYHLSKATDAISDFAPLATAMFGNYDYERVSPRIARNHSIPVYYSVDDILTDNQRAHAINNYNISKMGSNTGAYLAASNQSAANLMKANAQTRIYQKNKQNELIAKNIAQLNDWERYANNQMWAADVATDQNQGMAQQMKDLAIKDGYEIYTGRKYDRWKLSMLKPMFEYAVDDKIWKNMKV